MIQATAKILSATITNSNAKLSLEWMLGILISLGCIVLAWVIKLEVNRAVVKNELISLKRELNDNTEEFSKIREEFKVVEKSLSKVEGQNELQALNTSILTDLVKDTNKKQDRLMAMLLTINPNLRIMSGNGDTESNY